MQPNFVNENITYKVVGTGSGYFLTSDLYHPLVPLNCFLCQFHSNEYRHYIAGRMIGSCSTSPFRKLIYFTYDSGV